VTATSVSNPATMNGTSNHFGIVAVPKTEQPH
jgi:hypothetical protein